MGETAKSQGKRNEYREGERSGGNDRLYHGAGKGETGLLTTEYNLGILSKILDPQEKEKTQVRKRKSEKQISYINTYIWNLENGTDEPTCGAGIEMQT